MTTPLKPLDWLVIALYAVGMLLVGWFYGRRSKTSADYMLGGRNMSPMAVGLSLFATLLSTLSYLSFPGETIKYGPMVLAWLAALPLIAIVVGWGLIPVLMRQPVTSAYEILEMKLGLGVRLLGSVFFLFLRLFWMSLVIYATADIVLVRVLGVGAAAVPWLCAMLGLLTVVYTSWGGLRAVVMTDVIQTAILFGGAVLTLVVITRDMGGVSAWWPREWPAHWQEPVFWHDPEVRYTFIGMSLSMFTWFVCTAGSDQVAVQRYMATRDARAARQMYLWSLGAELVVSPLLAVVGIALLAYFQLHTDLVPSGVDPLRIADDLLPIFIVQRLPAGISGLVIAGLLAAAMSSLSSGLNSSCSVVMSDFVERFRRDKLPETVRVRLSQLVSVGIGLLVVALGSLVSQVEGNLLELCFKIANLLTAPLFVLMFLALFVPWATPLGAYAGAAVGVYTAVAIGFYSIYELGFVWLIPASFITGTGMAALVSLMDKRLKQYP